MKVFRLRHHLKSRYALVIAKVNREQLPIPRKISAIFSTPVIQFHDVNYACSNAKIWNFMESKINNDCLLTLECSSRISIFLFFQFSDKGSQISCDQRSKKETGFLGIKKEFWECKN